MAQQNTLDAVAQAAQQEHQHRKLAREQARAEGREELARSFAPYAFLLWLVADLATAILALNMWLGGQQATLFYIYYPALIIFALLLSIGRIAVVHWSDTLPAPVVLAAAALYLLNVYANAEGAFAMAAFFSRPIARSLFSFVIVAAVEWLLTTFLEHFWLDPLIQSRAARATAPRRSTMRQAP